MLHLLDANVLITANNQYYPLARVPEFWDWLRHVSAMGLVKLPVEMMEEVGAGSDDLAAWIKDGENAEALRLAEDVEIGLVQRVIEQGYAPDLDDTEITAVGNDPFLIAHALRDIANRTVVTTEASKPKRQRANRHIPDVCRVFGVPCINSFEFVRALDFSTSWRPGRSEE